MPSTNHSIVQCACGTGASPITGADGGTDLLLFRKDRVQCSKGNDLLRDYRIKDDSPTRRVVATCCNSAMFLDFQKGHWFSIYRARFGSDAPSIQVRIQTKYRPEKSRVASKVPEFKSYPLKFIAKLMAARFGMLVRKLNNLRH